MTPKWYPDGIEVKALCLVEHEGRWLMQEFFHPDTQERYVRFLGGAVDKGEYAQEAIIREFREEIGATLVDVELTTVQEHVFPYRDDIRHQIVFVFKGRIAEPELLAQEEFFIEEFGHRWRAFWITKTDLAAGLIPMRPAILPFAEWLGSE